MTDATHLSSNYAKGPWHPMVILLVSLVCTPLPGGVLHAMNFARLGYPSRVKPALISNILLALLIIFVSIRAVFMGPASQQIRFLAVFLTFATAVHFYSSQIKLFRVVTSQGVRPAGWFLPCLFGLAFVLLVIGVNIGVDQFWLRDFHRGVALIESGKYSEAEKIFLEYRKQNPELVETHYNLAIIYLNTGRVELARSSLQMVLGLDPTDQEAQEFLQSLEPPEGNPKNGL